MNEFGEVMTRDGIAIEKGVTLTREFLDSNEELFTKYLNLWILYPDLFWYSFLKMLKTSTYYHIRELLCARVCVIDTTFGPLRVLLLNPLLHTYAPQFEQFYYLIPQ